MSTVSASDVKVLRDEWGYELRRARDYSRVGRDRKRPLREAEQAHLSRRSPLGEVQRSLRLAPLYAGYGTLIRGYDVANNIEAGECGTSSARSV